MMSASARPLACERQWQRLEGRIAELLLRPVHLLVSAPCALFLAALAAMLLRHPDVQFYEIDRVAFVLLVVGVLGRAVVLRQPILVLERASWPMLALTVLAVASVAGGLCLFAQQADNTAANKGQQMSAQNQGSSAAGRDLTQKIRREIVKDKTLSTYTRNIKIISKDGQVTLKGREFRGRQESLGS